jgi:hypothetical protein
MLRCGSKHLLLQSGNVQFRATEQLTMNTNEIARIAALVGEPARTAMLLALMDGRALTANELASVAQVQPQTASKHLWLRPSYCKSDKAVVTGIIASPRWMSRRF